MFPSALPDLFLLRKKSRKSRTRTQRTRKMFPVRCLPLNFFRKTTVRTPRSPSPQPSPLGRGSHLRCLSFLLLMSFAFGVPPHLHAQSGMVDTNFNAGDGVDLSVYSIALQPNGQVIIAGNFTSFNDVDRINVARLNADGSRDDKFDPGTNVFGGPYPYVNAIALLSNGQ